MFLPHTGEKRRERFILSIVGNACCQLSNQSFEGFLIMSIRSFERMANCLTHKTVHGSESTGHGFNQRMDHLSVGLRGRLGRTGVQVGRGAGHGHGHVGACLALLQHTSGGAEPWK